MTYEFLFETCTRWFLMLTSTVPPKNGRSSVTYWRNYQRAGKKLPVRGRMLSVVVVPEARKREGTTDVWYNTI